MVNLSYNETENTWCISPELHEGFKHVAKIDEEMAIDFFETQPEANSYINAMKVFNRFAVGRLDYEIIVEHSQNLGGFGYITGMNHSLEFKFHWEYSLN